MIVESGNLQFLDLFDFSFGVKAFLILFLVFYVFFATILLRQIGIMNKKLPTKLSPVLKFIGIIHLGVSVAVLLMVIGNF